MFLFMLKSFPWHRDAFAQGQVYNVLKVADAKMFMAARLARAATPEEQKLVISFKDRLPGSTIPSMLPPPNGVIENQPVPKSDAKPEPIKKVEEPKAEKPVKSSTKSPKV